LLAYKTTDKFANFTKSDLRQYASDKRVVDAFRNFYTLGQFSFKELDKFLGYTARLFIRRSTSIEDHTKGNRHSLSLHRAQQPKTKDYYAYLETDNLDAAAVRLSHRAQLQHRSPAMVENLLHAG
jgi:hypothetical protein